MSTSSDLIANPLANYPLATVACFDPTMGNLPRRELDPERTIDYLERLASAGAPGLLIAASTGHGHLRQTQELRQWFEAAGRADLKGCVKMALLRPEDGEHENAQLIDLLAELDYGVVFVRPGTNLRTDATDEEVAQNMSPVVQAAAQRQLAVGIYSIPDVSGLPLSTEAALLLVDGPGGNHIVAAKVTEANYDLSTRCYLEHPRLQHLKIVQGWDPHIARALQDDSLRCGVTSGPMSFAVFQYLHILSVVSKEDWDEVTAAQDAVTRLFESMQDDPSKFADLQRAKYIMGLGQPLTGEVREDQVQRVFDALRSVPRREDQSRLARSLDLMGDGPFHQQLAELSDE